MHVFSNYKYCKTQYRELINKKADEELPSLIEEKRMTLHMQLQKIAFLLVQINYTVTNISKMTQIQMKRTHIPFSVSFFEHRVAETKAKMVEKPRAHQTAPPEQVKLMKEILYFYT